MGRKTELLIEELYDRYNEYIESIEDDGVTFEQWINNHLCDECLEDVLTEIDEKIKAEKVAAVMIGM